jgi:phage tail sheath protein FI
MAFEPNNHLTWDVLRSRVTTFLSGIYQQGMLAGGNLEEAFFVKCDAETNSPEQIDNGILICDIGVAPLHPAEFIMISLTQTMNAPSS